MSYKTTTIRHIEVVGTIWMSTTKKASMVYELTHYDAEIIKGDSSEITRKGVRDWLGTHAGDFQSIIDFHADIADFDSPWEDEANELFFFESQYGTEE